MRRRRLRFVIGFKMIKLSISINYSSNRIKELQILFVYQRQTAWVRWGSARSSYFGIVNGTRQGSVLSPCIFAIYMDELLQDLRNLGVGCHIGDVFMGAAGFADDVILLAPSRVAMQMMLTVCQEFGTKNNLQYRS